MLSSGGRRGRARLQPVEVKEYEFQSPNPVELSAAVRDCSERGLLCAGRWAAEQLCGLPEPDEDDLDEDVVDFEHSEESDRVGAESISVID